jgi:phosphoglycerate dehydrogenase-like enzyme
VGEHTLIVLASPADSRMTMLRQLPAGVSVTVGDTPEVFAGVAPAADVLFNWSLDPALFRGVWELCPALRWVHVRAAGLDNLLFPELVASPVVLTNSTGVFSESLGEFALAAVLFFAKDLRRMLRAQAAGLWEPFDVTEVAGQTLGIIGYGDIGRAVATRAKALGMNIVAVRRSGPSAAAGLAVSRVYAPAHRLAMIAECDYLVVCAPLTSETRHMLGVAEFAAMKPDAVVINLGRGPVIDEEAMLAALRDKRIKGAALDVFDQEPLPAGHPLWSMENVLLSPHTADHTPDWLDQAMRLFIDQFERFRLCQPLRNVVDKQRGY